MAKSKGSSVSLEDDLRRVFAEISTTENKRTENSNRLVAAEADIQELLAHRKKVMRAGDYDEIKKADKPVELLDREIADRKKMNIVFEEDISSLLCRKTDLLAQIENQRINDVLAQLEINARKYNELARRLGEIVLEQTDLLGSIPTENWERTGCFPLAQIFGRIPALPIDCEPGALIFDLAKIQGDRAEVERQAAIEADNAELKARQDRDRADSAARQAAKRGPAKITVKSESGLTINRAIA